MTRITRSPRASITTSRSARRGGAPRTSAATACQNSSDISSACWRRTRGDRALVGARLTYADLSLFQVIAGLDYAFPRAMARQMKRHPKLAALSERVAARPRIKAYLASERRIPFNEDGIFRHYPELDG